jgi:hypothetical protein
MCRLFQYSRPMQRAELRHATRAPKASSSGVWVYVPVVAISSRTCQIRRASDVEGEVSAAN